MSVTVLHIHCFFLFSEERSRLPTGKLLQVETFIPYCLWKYSPLCYCICCDCCFETRWHHVAQQQQRSTPILRFQSRRWRRYKNPLCCHFKLWHIALSAGLKTTNTYTTRPVCRVPASPLNRRCRNNYLKARDL